MTIKQRILKLVYPFFMLISGKRSGKEMIRTNPGRTKSLQSFYKLNAVMINDVVLDFESLRSKKILIVNTASDCGYTRQYEDLQKLFLSRKDALIILGFPSNDFKDQESGSDEDIARFCKINYGVTFPLMKKAVVIKGKNQNKVFEWLSNSDRNGWNDNGPVWNFTKFLINEKGELTHYFHPSVSPLSKEILSAVDQSA